MASPRIVYLMYHELELPGRAPCQSEPGYARYVLPLEAFRSQMKWIKESGFRGWSVDQAIGYPVEPGVCITFDDGCETDLTSAAPTLLEFGFNATFYVTVGKIDTAGYLNATQLRELDAQRFEIGCHSMTHPYLSDLSEAELKTEIVDAKDRLEQIVGHGIEHFSCPGGRYNQQVITMTRRAGFKTVANSEFYANTKATNPYELGRVAMLRDLTISQFGAVCHGQGLWKKQFSKQSRRSVQRLLGNQTYDRLRGIFLGESR